MKKIVFILLLAVMLDACRKEGDISPQKGSLQFSLDGNAAQGGRKQVDEKPVAVILSIKDAKGNYIVQDRQVPLFNFGQSYTSEAMELAPGDYSVTQFQVLDDAGKVIFANPLAGSKLAYLVKKPSPIGFSISNGGSTLLAIEVIPVEEFNKPEDFGYASFGFKVIKPEKDINLTFLQSTNPFMATKGYDSAIVTFTSGQVVIRKKLKMISPVEARGTIKPSELGIVNDVIGRSWTAKVTGYYESIDQVLSNLHINEAVATAFIDITANASLIKFEGEKVKLINSSGVFSEKQLVWENWAHLTDETGYFHLVVKNDICDPQVRYDLFKEDIYYGNYDKSIWSVNPDGSNYQHHGYRAVDMNYTGKGSYVDNEKLAGFCPTNLSGDAVKLGDFYFALETSHGWVDCYLVWCYKDTPIDPEHPEGPKKKVGSFQLTTNDKAASAGGRKRLN